MKGIKKMKIEFIINSNKGPVSFAYASKNMMLRALGTSATKLKTCALLGMEFSDAILATADTYLLLKETKKFKKGVKADSILNAMEGAKEERREKLNARPWVIYLVQNLDLENAYKIGKTRNVEARKKAFRTFSQAGIRMLENITIPKEVKISDKDVREFLLNHGLIKQIARNDGSVSEFVIWVNPDDYTTFSTTIAYMINNLLMSGKIAVAKEIAEAAMAVAAK